MMKRAYLSVVLLSVAGAAFAFGFGFGGNGRLKTEERRVSSFSFIDMSGGGTLLVRQGSQRRVTVTLDDNLLDSYESTVRGGVLYLGFKPMTAVSHITHLEVEVTMPELEGLELGGAVDARLLDLFLGEDLAIVSSGASSIEGKIDYRNVRLEMAGGCKAKLAGEANSFEIELSGASELEAAELEAKKAVVEAAGACRLSLRVSENLRVDASGATSVRYYGNPKIEFDANGASTVTRAGD